MTPSALHAGPAGRSPVVMTRWLPALAAALGLLTGVPGSAPAAPQRGGSAVAGAAAPAPAASGQVAFPAAAGIRPGPTNVGPEENIGGPRIATSVNDVVVYDTGFTGFASTGGAIVYCNVHGGGAGAETILASSTTGSGQAFTLATGNGGGEVAVAPGGLVYYYARRVVGSVNYSDLVQLNPATLVRTVVSAGSNAALGPIPYAVSCFAWDFSTGTVVYFDTGATLADAARGFYRVNPTTGVRTAVSLTSAGGPVYVAPEYPVTDAFGNIFFVDGNSTTGSGTPTVVVEIPVTGNGNSTYGARKVVSSNTVGSQAGGTYQYLNGLWIDESTAATVTGGLPATVSLIVTDEGTSQTDSAIYRVPADTGAKAKLISYNGTNANTGSAIFDLPDAAVPDTTGRLYYVEAHSGTNGILTGIAAGTHAAVSLSGATNFSTNQLQVVPVPPPTPALNAPTTSNLLGTSATLNGNVTADGGVANAGIISRGFVYAATSANATPRIGGTGVTNVVNFITGTLPVAQNGNLGAFSNGITGLTSGVSYTYSAYAQDQAGFTYTTPIAFTAATAPAVTTSAAAAITGTSAALGGNVTSDGGAALTARGTVYSATNQTPTIGGTGVTNLPDPSATTGTYSDPASGLANGTTYYFRAYAANGAGTTYGSVLSFTTIARPTANAQSVTAAFNTAKAITLTGSDPNTPAQTLTYAVTASPAHGTLSGTAPNLTYTPTANYQGADSFQFTTTNASGLTSTAATVSLTVTAGTPTANAQTVSTAFNTATAITLTGTDPDSPALALTYTVVTAPAHGTLSGTAPNLTYTPTANYQGADSFTFRVSNGTNTSSAATVSLTVAAGTPTATAQSGLVVLLNTPTAITLTGSDPDSPALPLTYTVVGAPANGTLSGTAPNLTYAPATGYTGPDSFTFTVSNGQKTSATATVSLTVVGQPYVTGFTASGAVGSTVTLTGNNFLGTTGITFFRNVAAPAFTVVSDTQLTVVVPNGAKTGVITITNGVGTNTTSTKFTVTP